MIKIALLGFGKVGQMLLETIRNNPNFKDHFKIVAIWNRSYAVFDQFDISQEMKIYKDIDNLLGSLGDIDLVVECAHPNVVVEYGVKILSHTNLFISSPSAFADEDLRMEVQQSAVKNKHQCYLPLGASIGLWDVIRLDQAGQLKSLAVSMKKYPSSFKINHQETRRRMEMAEEKSGEVIIAEDNITEINKIAPQNTNTMAIYALAAASLGFSKCRGRLIADRDTTSHTVQLNATTIGGLKLSLTRDNPARHGAVTGSATFTSFLNSLFYYKEGISHNNFIFC